MQMTTDEEMRGCLHQGELMVNQIVAAVGCWRSVCFGFNYFVLAAAAPSAAAVVVHGVGRPSFGPFPL